MTATTTSTVVMGREPQTSSFAAAQPVRYYRLNRRGRIVVGALLALSLAGFFFLLSTLFGGVVQAAENETAHFDFVTVTVLPGDSLWEIADKVAPDADPRAVIALVEELNGLDQSQSLQVGQTLLVPKL